MTQKRMHSDLTQGSIQGHFVRMAAPMVIGILAIMAMYLVDIYFIGQLGKEPLAAMGFIFPVIGILNGIAFGIGAGTSSVISRAIGSKDTQKVQQYTTQAILLASLLALSFAVLGQSTIKPLFERMGAPENLIPLIREYISVWYYGCFLVVVPMVGNSAIRAAGNSRVPSLVMVSVAIVNIILDPILIFGLFGFPRLELQGAAIATITAYSVSFFMAIFILKYRLNMLVWVHCFQSLWQGWREILKVGLPAVGNNLIAPVSVAIVTWLVADFGIEAVAGFNIAARIEAFCLIPLMAVASIMGPFMGQNLGAHKTDRLTIGLRYSFIFAACWGSFIAVILLLTASWLASLFNNDPQVTSVTSHYLIIVPWSYALLGIVMSSASSATGMGSGLPALMLTLLRLVVLNIPLALIGAHWFGLTGLFSAACIANVTTGAIALIWIRHCLHEKCHLA